MNALTSREGFDTLTELVKFVPIGTAGCHALDVKDSNRLWHYYHERYCMTLVTSGQAHWRYRNRYSEASTRGVMLMEPGEVHVNTSVEEAGSFFAVCISPDHIAQLTRDFGLAEVHFGAQFLKAQSCITQLKELKRVCELEEPAAQEEQLCLTLQEVLFRASEQALRTPGRAPTPVRRGANLLRESYHSERWKTVDVRQIASQLGISYHWFVHSFKQEFGVPPYRFVQSLRCAYARSLIAKGPNEQVRTMRDVALTAGYADSPHMSRDFKRSYGLTPGQMATGMNKRWPAQPNPVARQLAHAS